MPDKPEPLRPVAVPAGASSAIAVLAIVAFAAQAMVRVTDSLLPPIARGTAVAIFSWALYLGQTRRRRGGRGSYSAAAGFTLCVAAAAANAERVAKLRSFPRKRESR